MGFYESVEHLQIEQIHGFYRGTGEVETVISVPIVHVINNDLHVAVMVGETVQWFLQLVNSVFH